jgi:hypothetical protein
METFRNTIAPVLTIRHVAQAVAFYERAFGEEVGVPGASGLLAACCAPGTPVDHGMHQNSPSHAIIRQQDCLHRSPHGTRQGSGVL